MTSALIDRKAGINSLYAVPSKTRLTVIPEIPFNEAKRLLEQVVSIGDAAAWWIGDALNAMERFRPDYPEALTQIDNQYGHLRVYARVSEKVIDRAPELTWAHHELVANLEPQEQSRALDNAARHGWTTSELQLSLFEMRQVDAAPRPPQLTVKAIGELYDKVERAAHKLGQEPAVWARETLEKRADEVLAA